MNNDYGIEENKFDEMFDHVRGLEKRNARNNEKSDKQMVDDISNYLLKEARKEKGGKL